MAQAAATMQATRIGGYEVLGRLGAGGMGVVYKAADLKLKRPVALKFLATEAVAAADKERLLREARAASALDHPNIATVHAVEEAEDGRLFIVMAYYEGETLAEKMRGGPLQPAKAINIASQVARGLQHAHTHGVVHRDIKPSNVIMTSEGMAKIVDFGLARQFAPSGSTQSASLAGTLSYMSPEQASGKAVDVRTDIWSLGVVLYQMLTGRLPFDKESAGSTVLAILNSPPAPMGKVSEALTLVIYRALAKTPADRYQSCAELLKDFQGLALDDRRPTAAVDKHELHRRVHLAALSAAPKRVSRRALWMASLAAVVLLALLVAWAAPAVRARFFGSSATSGAANKTSSPAYDSYLKGQNYLERYDKPANIEAAIAQFRAAVAADPNFALGFAGLGEAYWDKYRINRDLQWIPQAETYSRRAIELNDQLPSVHIILGRILTVANQRDLALHELQQALKLDAQNADALRGLAAVYDSTGRRDDAERLYREATVLRPDSWSAFNEFGNFYLRHREYAKAAGQYRRAVELTPDNAHAHNNLGLTLDNLGRAGEAEPELKKSIQLQPTGHAYTMLGRLYYRQRRWADAAAMMEQGLQLDRGDYRLWANLALTYDWLGDKERADRAYAEELVRLEAVAKLNPDDADVQSRLGLLYARQHLRAKAISHLEGALARAPDRPDILSNAADGYEYLGDRSRALDLAKKALAKGMSMQEFERDPRMRALRLDPRFQRLTGTARTTVRQR
ncbi:MAG: protein kinase [Terriglobales bacterium]|jgi:serine/threonine-protein kinase